MIALGRKDPITSQRVSCYQICYLKNIVFCSIVKAEIREKNQDIL